MDVSFFTQNYYFKIFFFYSRNKGAIALTNSVLTIDEGSHVEFSHNFDNLTAAVYMEESTIVIHSSSVVSFNNNVGRHSGAILLTTESSLEFYGTLSVFFCNNSGSKGGALALTGRSELNFNEGNTYLYFTDNHASVVGGALYVQDSDYYQRLTYEYWPDILGCGRDPYFSVGVNVHPHFYFSNNTASLAGSAQYGGGYTEGNSQYFIFDNSSYSDLSVVSSDPIQVCICTTSKPHCNIRSQRIQLFPGQTFEIEAVAVGEGNGTVPSYVTATFLQPSRGQLQLNEYVQNVGRVCSKLEFTIMSSQQTETLLLTISTLYTTSCHTDIFNNLKQFNVSLIFDIKSCPTGFYYSNELKLCQCHQTLISNGIHCDLNTMKVLRVSPKWINATFTNLSSAPGVIVHNHCPFDYCKLIDGVQPLDLLYPDQQCVFDRSGILCGACKANFSHVLGTSKCKQCTKPWIALIVPLIAIAGVILVVGLTYFNLTISVGTINGLILYANIVMANRAIFFPHTLQAANLFLNTFIAWLNLDLGIETCFYNGLDAYSKTWFQFLFPLYIWFMVITIIVASHYSTHISKLCGNNAVQVLATLFLLSYAKLLRLIITVFSSTELISDAYYKKVWLYDGNVEYIKGKHLPLFIVAFLLLIFMFVPYTIILLCIQWLQRLSNYQVLFLVRKLQPLIDAYTGPYKIRHRYWTGLLLLVRICLFLVFSLNVLNNPNINLLAIASAMFCLLAYLSMVGGVYKLWWLNLIEIAFILNIGILSIASIYQINSDSAQRSVTYTSTAIAFALFIAIVIYHLVQKIINSRKFKTLMKSKNIKEAQEHDQIETRGQINEATTTTIELWKPLIDHKDDA